MKILTTSFYRSFIISLLALSACSVPIERSGVVVDRNTNMPLEEVNIDIYLKYQRRDSLSEKVYTDKAGRFDIKEKRGDDLLFELSKNGYINHVNTLSVKDDTIRMEKVRD